MVSLSIEKGCRQLCGAGFFMKGGEWVNGLNKKRTEMVMVEWERKGMWGCGKRLKKKRKKCIEKVFVKKDLRVKERIPPHEGEKITFSFSWALFGNVIIANTNFSSCH